MKHLSILLSTLTLLLSSTAFAQQVESYDYWKHQRAMVQRGQQAVLMCNGLFTGDRTLEQVFAQELGGRVEIGLNASHSSGAHEDVIDVVFFEKTSGGGLVAGFRSTKGKTPVAPRLTSSVCIASMVASSQFVSFSSIRSSRTKTRRDLPFELAVVLSCTCTAKSPGLS